MILWRISNYADLSGTGGLLHGGRWHSRGRPVVYLAESPAGALVEALVHVQASHAGQLPASYQLLEVQLPDDATSLPAVLPGDAKPAAASTAAATAAPAAPAAPEAPDWRADMALTRRLGDAWLATGSSLLLRVPSAVVARSHNRLFNPLHPQAQGCRVLSVARHPFDGRLLAARG